MAIPTENTSCSQDLRVIPPSIFLLGSSLGSTPRGRGQGMHTTLLVFGTLCIRSRLETNRSDENDQRDHLKFHLNLEVN